MKTKSTPGFVLGLIGGILGGIFSIFSYAALTLIIVAISLAENVSADLFAILLYVNIFSNIVAIVGSCFYFSKAKVGAFIMLIAFIMYILVYINLIIIGGLFNALFFVIIASIPAVMMLLSSILGFKAQKIQN